MPHSQFYCPIIIINPAAGGNKNYIGYAAFAGEHINAYYGPTYGGNFTGVPSGFYTYGNVTWYTD